MKRTCTAVIVCLVLAVFGVSSAAAGTSRRGPGKPPPFPESVQAIMDRTAMDTMAISVLAGMTGESEDVLWDMLGDGHVFDLVKEFSVDPETFRKAMDTKIIEKITAAVSSGAVTQADAEEAISMIQNRPEKPDGDHGPPPEENMEE